MQTRGIVVASTRPAERRCIGASVGNTGKHNSEQSDCYKRHVNLPQKFEGTACVGVDWRQSDSHESALTQELETRNEFIQTTTCKMRALSAALEEALRRKSMRPRSRVLQWAAAIGTALFGASLYHAFFC